MAIPAGKKETKDEDLPLAYFPPLPPLAGSWATDAVQRPVPGWSSVVQRRIGMLGFLPGAVRIGGRCCVWCPWTAL